MDPMLTIAVRAVRAAGDIIVRAMDRVDLLNITPKGRNDFVSEVDKQAEREIIAILQKAYPTHGFLGEEGGRQSGSQGKSDFMWVIDPLDGTTNFLHGFPQFYVSIALMHKGKIECGVVYDPNRQELFTAKFAEACPEAKPVKTAVCRRAGLGSSEVNCEFGLGEDEYLRNKATLVEGKSAWTLKDPEAVCAAAK